MWHTSEGSPYVNTFSMSILGTWVIISCQAPFQLYWGTWPSRGFCKLNQTWIIYWSMYLMVLWSIFCIIFYYQILARKWSHWIHSTWTWEYDSARVLVRTILFGSFGIKHIFLSRVNKYKNSSIHGLSGSYTTITSLGKSHQSLVNCRISGNCKHAYQMATLVDRFHANTLWEVPTGYTPDVCSHLLQTCRNLSDNQLDGPIPVNLSFCISMTAL